MKPKRRFSLFHLIIAALSGMILAFVLVTVSLSVQFGPELDPIAQSLALIRARFVGDYDPEQVTDMAITGMVAGLNDRWSHYLSPADYAAHRESAENAYVGIGITISYRDERGLLIDAVHPASPAAESGMRPGELIIAADGISLAGEARQNGTDLIRGEEGTTVTLTVLADDGSRRDVTLERRSLELDPVSARMLDGQVGYIRLSNFYAHSADRLIEETDALAAQGATALVYDMRSNGGGYVKELTAMLDHLLPEGPVFRSISADGDERITLSDPSCVELPMAILVNEDTYSAAEFFAAELKEAAGAVIVGETTSGKGYSQQPLPLKNGGALSISTARYCTGEGVSLIGTGVSLDRELSLTPEAAEDFLLGQLAPEEDTQLQAALELLDSEN